MSHSVKHYRICGYVRVTTKEQTESPEGSIKNQEERIKQSVRQKLGTIKRKKVNLVVVTELSRLSRNTKEFYEMWEFFESNGCEFQSLREHFDTTCAAGVLMIKSMANGLKICADARELIKIESKRIFFINFLSSMRIHSFQREAWFPHGS